MSVFQLRPALLDPVRDRLLVALHCPAGWPLPGPVQLVPQHVPDMAWVVGDAGHALDHRSHTRQRAEVGDIAVRFGAIGERLCDLRTLRVVQLRFPSCTSGATQAVAASLPPRLAPLGYD